jgi:hypothetical protein
MLVKRLLKINWKGDKWSSQDAKADTLRFSYEGFLIEM